MSPLNRRRRRRPALPTLAAVLAVVIAVLLLVGGISKMGPASRSYLASVDRSFAAQGAVLVSQSDRTGAQLQSLWLGVVGQTRGALQARLDSLRSASRQTAAAAETLSPPSPSGDLGPVLVEVLGERAAAVQLFHRTLDHLLGMAPPPGDGAPASATAAQRPLSTGRAVTDLVKVGATLEKADRTFAELRRAFRGDAGGPTIPPSVWITDPSAWTSSQVQSVVAQIVGSPQLASTHRVVLLTGALGIAPAPVPPVPGAAASGTSVVPPTHHLAITAVVDNQGNVSERGVTVTAAVQPEGGGAGARRRRSVSLEPGGSAAVILQPLPVVPGRTYAVTVAVGLPAGETDPSSTTTASFTVEVGPSSTASTASTASGPS